MLQYAHDIGERKSVICPIDNHECTLLTCLEHAKKKNNKKNNELPCNIASKHLLNAAEEITVINVLLGNIDGTYPDMDDYSECINIRPAVLKTADQLGINHDSFFLYLLKETVKREKNKNR